MNEPILIPIMRNLRNLGLRFASNSTIEQVPPENMKQDAASATEFKLDDMPVEMENPYKKDKRLCILCKYEITPDYKNIRLLSQFVSRFTGKVYGRHITGLCKKQQRKLETEIIKAHRAGLMASYYREPRFAHDPKLFDANNPFRPHRF